MSLIHCIYASAASPSFVADDLPQILNVARRNNGALGITGMLLHVPGSFFQVLEGPEDVVDALYATIVADRRHERVSRIIREAICKRVFADWTMGFTGMAPESLDRVVGQNDFFRAGSCLTTLDEGRAKKLLTAFSKGRWRATISGAIPRPFAA